MKALSFLAAFLLMLSSASAQTGVRIRGQVVPVPGGTPDGVLRVQLVGRNLMGRMLDAPVQRDGTFELEDVPPGQMSIREGVLRSSLTSLLVRNDDVEGVVLMEPVRLLGQIEPEAGGWLPNDRDPIDPVLRLEIRGQKTGKKSPEFMRSDGVFAFAPLPPDDYEVRALLLPKGYTVKSMSYGDREIAQGRFTVTGTEQAFLHITVATADGTARDSGTLIVTQSDGTLYIEGAFSFFDLRSTDPAGLRQKRRLGGEWCARGCQPSGPQTFDSLALAIPAGEYQISGYVRPCNGNCGRLGPPTAECRATFTITTGQTLYANRIGKRTSCDLNVSAIRPQGIR